MSVNPLEVLKWLGKPTLSVGAVAASCALVLLAIRYPEFAAAKAIIAPYVGWVQLCLIGSGAILGVFLFAKCGKTVQGTVDRFREEAALSTELQNLSEPEKEILRFYLQTGSRSASFSIREETVNGLVARGILYHQGIGTVHGAPTHVKAYVWRKINKHPELLV